MGRGRRILFLRAVWHGHEKERLRLSSSSQRRPYASHRIRKILRAIRKMVRPEGRSALPVGAGDQTISTNASRAQIVLVFYIAPFASRMMKYWSSGVLECWVINPSITPILHHSSTPTLIHFLNR